ncbi:olfactory receptor 1496-like [Anguilla anguilla]|uniref:olfactory receptor 1496-like n=1 Tax=Anguilla anguilla TaxID=7936 RepID=UPI0015ABE1C1|nr:olfactory receptor 1496-like [Anguilla anguilla]
MENISYYKMFSLSKPKASVALKHIFFALSLILYVLIIIVNFMLIVIILLEKTLHKPMYIFLCNLCINGLYGTAGFYPKFLFDLFSDSFEISYSACFLQAFVIYSSALCELATLTVMAYDRYIAICRPLNYHSIMTNTLIVKLLLFSWIFPAFSYGGALLITNTMSLCGSHIDKFYCDNLLIMKLSCKSTDTHKSYGLICTVIYVLMVLFIIYSYCTLISSCRKCAESKNKFKQTCVPHLLSLVNFTFALLFDTMYSRYGSRDFSQDLYNILTLEFLVIPPVLNPIIYGLKLTEVRKRALRVFINVKVTDSK